MNDKRNRQRLMLGRQRRRFSASQSILTLWNCVINAQMPKPVSPSEKENPLLGPRLAPSQCCNLKLNPERKKRVADMSFTVEFFFSLQKSNHSVMQQKRHAARCLSSKQEFREQKACLPLLYMLPFIPSAVWSWSDQPDMNAGLSKFYQSFQLLPGDRPKRTTWPQIKGELRAPLLWAGMRRCIANGFEMQRRRGLCLHDDIVFIHQKQTVEKGNVAALFGDGEWQSTWQRLGGTPI